jgi:uncharacterized membrane protein
MEDAAIIICTWLHLIVLVIWIGHMFNSLLLFSPLASTYVHKDVYGDFIAEYRRRDQPVALSCIAIFIITGIILMLLDTEYEGIGNIFVNTWSIMLFIKHLLVLAMIGLGVYQGKKVMPGLAVAAKKLSAQNDADTVSSFTRLEKVRIRVTQSLVGLAAVVLLLTAVGDIM